MKALDLLNTDTVHGNARIQAFAIFCLNDGYDAFVKGESKADTTGERLCQRHCSQWRVSHELWAKRIWSVGYDQAALDVKIEAGEL